MTGGASGDAYDRPGFQAAATPHPFERTKLIVYTTLHRVEFVYGGVNYNAEAVTKPFGVVALKVWRAGALWKWSATGTKLLKSGTHRARNAAGYAAVLACHDVPHTNPVTKTKPCKTH